jgi:hypothetical protein
VALPHTEWGSWDPLSRRASIKSLLAERSAALFLLRVCLADISRSANASSSSSSSASASGADANPYRQLIGVPLIPLANGALACFEAASAPSSYFVAAPLEYELLATQPKLRDHLVAVHELDPELRRHFDSAALRAVCNIQVCDSQLLAYFLCLHFCRNPRARFAHI